VPYCPTDAAVVCMTLCWSSLCWNMRKDVLLLLFPVC